MRTQRSTAMRLRGSERRPLDVSLDGQPVDAMEGDTVLAALLAGGHLLSPDAAPRARAGFCLIGACQDCWIEDSTGRRFRACVTPAADGMALRRAAAETT